MDPNLFRYIWKHTRRDQLWIIFVILASLPFLFMALDLPKLIVNGPIQGKGFDTPDATVRAFAISFSLPEWLGGTTLHLFDGFELGRMGTLLSLSLVFLALVCVNGLFKFYINTFKGRLGERMLRRLRFELIDRVLRFPLPHFKKVKAAEVATMVKDEVEPLGGFIGDAYVQPVFLSGQALTAMAFILVQNVLLGSIAAGIVLIQAFLIPRLRKRLLVLGKQQQLTARDLAGRVGEVVDGIAEVRTNDATNYERADIASRLARIFFIRYELYQRKFFVKFLNNFLAQLTPFLFFLIGGYFAIRGSLDIGQLVAVIAAYRDLPGPIKELIDWDQQRQDVQIKYTQVSEQFSPEPLKAAHLQPADPHPSRRMAEAIEVRGLTVTDDTGAKVLEPTDMTLAPGEWVAAVGDINAGAEAAAEALAQLVLPTAGRIKIGEQQLEGMPESVTGRRIAYVGPDTYLRNVSLRECLLQGLMNYPLRLPESSQRHGDYVSEARASGNSELDIEADWVDYERVGAAGGADIDRQIIDVLAIVDLDDDVFEFGLRSSHSAIGGSNLEARILEARIALKKKIVAASIENLVEPFDPDRYQAQASIAENLVFGAALDQAFKAEQLAANPVVLEILAEQNLDNQLYSVGSRILATVVELFGDLPPDHPFFDRLSLVRPEEVPSYKSLNSRIADRDFATVGIADRQLVMGLAFGYIEPVHRLSLLSDEIRARIVDARRLLIERIAGGEGAQVAIYEPDRFNAGSSLEANILFGRVTHGVADATQRVRQAVRETLLELGLRDIVLIAGLGFVVGPAGKRLSQVQRQKIAVARALLKRPDLLIVNRGLSSLSARAQRAILASVSKAARPEGQRPKFGAFWVLASPTLVDIFDRVVVFRDGRVTADGAPAALLETNKHLQRLVA
jgi:putative ABC transport system ATP-binding protein